MTLNSSFFAIPDDTIWSRGGSPFRNGEGEAGVFPPSPSTWQGMIRTRVLYAHAPQLIEQRRQADIERLIGTAEALPAGWSIQGPLPAQRIKQNTRLGLQEYIEPWVPWPLFLSSAKKGQIPDRARTGPIDGWVGSSHPTSMPMRFPDEAKAPTAGWISARNLYWALLGKESWNPEGATDEAQKRAQGGADLPPFVAEEPRTGLAIDDAQGRAQDHMLYTAIHHRFQPDTGLWGALIGAPPHMAQALRQGWATLGKKNRTLTLSAPPPIDGWEDLLTGAHLRGQAGALYLRVVLLTPALVPHDSGKDRLPFDLAGATLLSMQARRGPDLGAIDRIGRKSLGTRSTWAAGSCFYLSLPAQPNALAQDAVIQRILGRAHPTNEERFGFGLRVAAVFNPKNGNPGASNG